MFLHADWTNDSAQSAGPAGTFYTGLLATDVFSVRCCNFWDFYCELYLRTPESYNSAVDLQTEDRQDTKGIKKCLAQRKHFFGLQSMKSYLTFQRCQKIF
ncbi:uncharacterized protein LOC112151430 isoform X3 [Oryzias melastigma]|uniref:uncharacterized protein LOC112151430 isoform X3 n=1 Tax=Oryzias melastigma TaxID=30732 RepID=UPI00168CF07F|nr:uncharacterized protein LOC112151430 isoform X3 [Oryzias melastigma]